MAYASMRAHNTRDHEDGMSVVDSYIDESRPLAYREDDRVALFQQPVIVSHVHEPLDKTDADHQECRRQMQYIAQRNLQPPPTLPGHPPILHELSDALFQPFLLQQKPLPQEFVVATWYSDHVGRPHSGLDVKYV